MAAPSDPFAALRPPAPEEPMTLRFGVRGAGRFAEAAFLAFWLLGWAVGEVAVLAILGHGLLALLRQAPLLGGALPVGGGAPAAAPSLAIGAFLVLWLAFWTLGGTLALRQLLRCLWAEDRLSLEGEDLVRRRRLGPFRSTRRWSRREIRRLHVRAGGSGGRPLMAQLARRRVALTDLGTPAEREEAAVQLSRWLGLPAPAPVLILRGAGPAAEADTDPGDAAARAELPEGWQCLEPPFGSPLLVPDRTRRRRQGLVTATLALAVDAGALLLVRAALTHPDLWPPALMLGLPAVLLTWGAVWLLLGRREWRIESRRLVLQERFAGRVRERQQASGLELSESSDSDGDSWYDLRAIDLGDPTAGLTTAGVRRAGGSVSIVRTIHDPTEPRTLGLWLSHHSGVPFHDRVPTPAERAADRALLLEQLGASGALGSWLVRRIQQGEGRGGKG